MTDAEAKLRQRYPKLDELNRAISWFDKDTDEMVDGFYIENPPLSVLQKLFNCDPDDPVVYGYNITEKEAKVLSQYTNIEFDFARYNYQFGTYYDYKRAGPWEGGEPFPVPSGE